MNPIKNHEGQLKVWRDNARFKVLVAGRRWGKTVYIREQLLKYSDKPNSNVVYVAPTRIQAKDIMWRTLKDRVNQLKWKCRINESELSITRNNGSKIEIKSAEKPGRLRGRGLSFIAFDEYAEYRTDEIWSQVARPALSDKRGHAVFCMTPKGFNHGFDIYQHAKTEDDWSSYSFRTIDSPFFQTPEGKKELEDAKNNLSERDYKQEYEASFENFGGRIYYAFDRDSSHSHLIYQPGLGLIIGQDFNRSPMASCIFQKIGGKLVQIDELFLPASSTEEMCRVVLSRYPNEQNIVFRPDATGSRRTSNSSRSDHQIIKQYGFSIQAPNANPKRLDRWAAVNRALEKGDVLINTRKCPKTVKDLETICYKEGTCEPNLNDPMLGHIADAFGYAVNWEYPILGKMSSYAYA